VPRDISDVFGDIEAGLGFKHTDHRKARREQRGLGVFSEGEVAFRPFEHQT